MDNFQHLHGGSYRTLCSLRSGSGRGEGRTIVKPEDKLKFNDKEFVIWDFLKPDNFRLLHGQ